MAEVHPAFAMIELHDAFYTRSEGKKSHHAERLEQIHDLAEHLLKLQTFFNAHKKDKTLNLNDFPEFNDSIDYVHTLGASIGMGIALNPPDNRVWENTESIEATIESIKANQEIVSTKTQQEFSWLQQAFQEAAYATDPAKEFLKNVKELISSINSKTR